WAGDGFAAGQRIQVSGTTLDDGLYTVTGVSGNTLQLARENVVQAETISNGSSVSISTTVPASTSTVTLAHHTLTASPDLAFPSASPPGAPAGNNVIGRTSGSWAADGFRAGDEVIVSGTQHNDGVYHVVTATNAILTLDTTNKVTDETLTSAGPSTVATAVPQV